MVFLTRVVHAELFLTLNAVWPVRLGASTCPSRAGMTSPFRPLKDRITFVCQFRLAISSRTPNLVETTVLSGISNVIQLPAAPLPLPTVDQSSNSLSSFPPPVIVEVDVRQQETAMCSAPKVTRSLLFRLAAATFDIFHTPSRDLVEWNLVIQNGSLMNSSGDDDS